MHFERFYHCAVHFVRFYQMADGKRLEFQESEQAIRCHGVSPALPLRRLKRRGVVGPRKVRFRACDFGRAAQNVPGGDLARRDGGRESGAGGTEGAGPGTGAAGGRGPARRAAGNGEDRRDGRPGTEGAGTAGGRGRGGRRERRCGLRNLRHGGRPVGAGVPAGGRGGSRGRPEAGGRGGRRVGGPPPGF